MKLFRNDLIEATPPADITVPRKKNMMCLNESTLDPYKAIDEALRENLKHVSLNRYFNSITQDLKWGDAKRLPLNWGLQCFFLLRHLWNVEAIVISFGGYFSLLPIALSHLFNVKSLLILNGTDCVSFPEYNYGSLRKPLLKSFIKYSLKWTDCLLPVDESLIYQEHQFDEQVKNKKQGIKAFFHRIKTPYKVVPNGFDTEFWTNELSSKRNGFITVVATSKYQTALFKGVDLILELAKLYPKALFSIVGLSKELQSKLEKLANVKYYPFIKKEDLKRLYNAHQYYLQLSINEGFGCALSEAMLCGCIPVVANSGALPTVVGGVGKLINKRKITELERAVNDLQNLSESDCLDLSRTSRERILKNFDIKRREKLILEILKTV